MPRHSLAAMTRPGGLAAAGVLLPVMGRFGHERLVQGPPQPPCAPSTTPRPPGSPRRVPHLDRPPRHRNGQWATGLRTRGSRLRPATGYDPDPCRALLPVGRGGFAAIGQGIRAIPPQRNNLHPQGIDRPATGAPKPALPRFRRAAPVDPGFPPPILSEEHPAAVMPVQRHATPAAPGCRAAIPARISAARATDLRRNDRLPPRRPDSAASLPWKPGLRSGSPLRGVSDIAWPQ